MKHQRARSQKAHVAYARRKADKRRKLVAQGRVHRHHPQTTTKRAGREGLRGLARQLKGNRKQRRKQAREYTRRKR